MTARTRCRITLALTVCVCVATTWACGRRNVAQAPLPPAPAVTPAPTVTPTPQPFVEASAACNLIPEPGERIATVALTERVNPANAPHPTNESERLVFRQLYETLLRVDCEGRAIAGLASSWALNSANNSTGLTWALTLRPDARFTDGSPVTAHGIVASWTDDDGRELRREIRRMVESARAIDERTLEITLRSQSAPGVAAPLALAHTDLAIAQRVPGSLWPLGTRTVVVVADRDASAAPSEILLNANLRFLIAPGRDTRDLLDEGVDLLLTREQAALEYAATLPQFVSVPLAWQQTRVLLPHPARPFRVLSPEERNALATDAIRGEARGAVGPFWWQSLPGCDVASSPLSNPPSSSRVVYDAADGAARDVAERFVGLRTYQSALALTGAALTAARQRGNDAGYILSLDNRPLDPCREMQVIVEMVGWVDPEIIVPLVDTRLQAIVRRGRSGVTVEWDGGLRLDDHSQ